MRWHLALPAITPIGVLAAGACWAQPLQGLPDAVLKEVRAAEELPKGTYTAVRTWEAEPGGHNTGRVVDDPDARNGKAWEAKPGVDAPGVLLYGPYIEVQPGDYVAFFRIKLLEPIEDDLPGQLDACVSYAQDILGAWDLTRADLTPGTYVQVPLGFRYDRGQLECRITWSGAAGLRVDGVSLFRLEGANLSRSLWRVPEAVPSGLPKDLAYYSEPRPFADIFPRSSPPATELLLCDLQKERPDMRLLIYSLQGLVNRTQPRLYCLSSPLDSQWLKHMQDRGWVKGTESVSQPQSLIERFRDSLKGVVITDADLPATKNIATMIASLEDGVVASPRLAKQLSLPVLTDLRGRWKTSTEAYQWAFDNLWAKLNHHVIACLWPEHLALRDYLVENKVFIFWMSGPLDGARKYASPDGEARLMEQLLAKMPANIPVMGYPWAGKDVGIGEGPGVTLFAEFGKYLVGSIDCSNLSVHSGIVVPDLRQAPAPPPPALQPDKVYLSFVISDGDNLPVLTISNFPQLWADKTRGQFPIGWTLSPSASLLLPDVVDYYYRSATPNDYFLGAVSGVGYTYPDSYGKRFREPDRQKVYDEFLDQTATYMKRSDLKGLWIMGATRPELISRYAERIPFLDALFPDYGRRLFSSDEVTYPTARNVPVFHAITTWRMDATREDRLAQMVADVRQMTPAQRPAFLHVFVLNWFTDLPLLQEALRQLGPDYVAVRPDHLAQLWRQDMQQRQVLVRLPSAGAGIEGQPLALKGAVRNMSDQPVRVQLRVPAGLDDAALTPTQAQLAPAQEATVTARGLPAGERIVLQATGSFGDRRAEMALRRIPASELAAPLPAVRDLTPAGYLEAEALPHRSGAREADPAASGQAVWVARAGQTADSSASRAEAGYIVFGPYLPLEPGGYLALFRLKRLGEGAGLLATLDTCVGGGTPQTGMRGVNAEELPLRQFRWFPIVFEHPGGAFETRVVWSGSAALAVDSIALWRIGKP